MNENILNQIFLQLQNLNAKVDKLGEHITNLETRMDSLEARMDSLEARMDSLETRMDSLEARMDSLETRMDSLEARMDSFENEIILLRQDTNKQFEKFSKDIAEQLNNVLIVISKVSNKNLNYLHQRVDIVDTKIDEHEKRIITGIKLLKQVLVEKKNITV